jgi:arginine decarboxylase
MNAGRNQDSTPVLDAIDQIGQKTYSFALPGHRFGRGIDDRTAEVLSRDTFAAAVLLAKSMARLASAVRRHDGNRNEN